MMSKQWVLSSLMSSTNPESTDDNGGLVGTSLGLKRVRDGHLYDGDGRPLKGFKREVAKLLYDNRHLGESDLHRLEQSLSDGNRVACTASDAGARSGEPRRSIFQRFPVLPDMFGVVSGAASAVKSCKALGGDGGDLRCTVPAGSRWSLVQRRHTRLKRMVEDIGSSSDDIVNPKDFPSAHVEGTGYRWVRADSLQVEEALAQSLLATPAVTLGEGCFSLNAGGTPGTTRGENTRNGSNTSWISRVCTFAPPEAELSIVGARFGTDLFGFFTLNEEEYATLGLDSASYQPSFVSRPNGSEETTLWSFDYETTVKLLTLYERFGNFVLVADRWVFTNSDGTAPAEARGAGDPVLPPPPVEALMERYKLVSEAILQHRLRLLKGALDNINGHGGGTATSASKHHKGQQGKESCAADKGKTKDTEDERAIASTHPLVTLMGKHPILEAQRRRQEWLAQRFKRLTPCDADSGDRDGNVAGVSKSEGYNGNVAEPDVVEERIILSSYRRDMLQGILNLPPTTSTSDPTVVLRERSSRGNTTNGSIKSVASGPSTIGLCGGTIGAGNNALATEAPPSVSDSFAPAASPFWYDGLLERARREQLRGDLFFESQENVPYYKALVALQAIDKQAALLLEKLRVLKGETAVPSTVETRELGTGSEGNSALITTEAEPEVEGRGVKRKRSAASGGAWCRKPSQQSAEPNTEDSYQAILEEVRRMPAVCERLKLCVQAGWFLPPPYSAKSSEAGSTGGNTAGGNEASGTTRSTAGNNCSGNINTIANRALSNSSEALLLSLPPNTPRIHRSVEHELEKHLWEDHRALCDDSAEVQQLLAEVRVLYTQNVILRRFSGKCAVLKAALKKLATDASSL